MSQGLGVLGGMGPLASAEFLKTIYESNVTIREQQMPRCILYSDPSIPDRTSAIHQSLPGPVISQMRYALNQLIKHDVSCIVITCITSHYFLPYLSNKLQERVISLIDITLSAIIKEQSSCLMFCTNGTRQASIFQNTSSWPEAAPSVLLPTDEDQHAIHELLYRVKQGDTGPEQVKQVERLLVKYQVESLVAGCTEMHVLTKQLSKQHRYRIVDPLLIVARALPEFLAGGVDTRQERQAQSSLMNVRAQCDKQLAKR